MPGLLDGERARVRLFIAACTQHWEALPGAAPAHLLVSVKTRLRGAGRSTYAAALPRRACARVQRLRLHARTDSGLPGARRRVRPAALSALLCGLARRGLAGAKPVLCAPRRTGHAVAQAAIDRLRAAQVLSAHASVAARTARRA